MTRCVSLALLLSLLASTNAYADDACVTSPGDFWICKGDPAWVAGYLISPDVFDLRKCDVWEKKAKLLELVQQERDEYRQQRDNALAELNLHKERADVLISEYDRCASDYNKCADALVETQDDLDSSFDTLDVALIASGTGVGALLVGLLVGALAL